ncbi:MAG: sensor domain-containing diguanylate cyclase [Actinobacteria bacterium]|nr:sensor domain-containing diguanylate cyclase [Actinomycetota bacterium]
MIELFIAGLGRGAKYVLNVFKNVEQLYQRIKVVGALENNPNSVAIEDAKSMNIPVYHSIEEIKSNDPDIVLNLTGNEEFIVELRKKFNNADIISGKGSKIIFELLEMVNNDYELYHALYNATVLLLSKEKQHEVLNAIMNEALKVLNCPAGSIALYDPKTRSFSLVTSAGLTKHILAIQRWKPRKGGLTFAIIESKEQPFVLEDTEKTDFDLNPLIRKEKIRFIAANKLMAQDDLLGILYVDDFKPRKMSEHEKKTLELFAQIAGLALEKFRLIEANREMALTDSLTGLNNHRYFHERITQEISRARRYRKNLSLLMIDVDNFKKYNDANGHLTGDDALKRISTIIKENIRAADVAVRYGGEEFMVILPETAKEQALMVAERIRLSVEKEPFIGEDALPGKKLTVSIGVATFPEDSEIKDELIKKADDAMYAAKLRGKNCVVCSGEEPSPS